MKLVKLTDFYNNTNSEYSAIDEIVNIEPYEEDIFEEREKTVLNYSSWLFGPDVEIVKVQHKIGVNKGSRIHFKNGGATSVQERPAAIIEKIRTEAIEL